MNINQSFIYCEFIANKAQIGRTFTPDEYNEQFPEAELDFCRSIMRPPSDQLHNWRTLTPAVDDIRLQPIKRDFTLNFTSGKADLPNTDNSQTEFMDWLSFALPVTLKDNCDKPFDAEIPVEVVTEDEWATRLSAPIRKPEIKFPITKFIFDQVKKVQGAPTVISQMRLSYYKIPRRPFFAFTLDANDNIIYDATNSIQSELPPITSVSVCNILLSKIGVNLQDPTIQNYANQAKQLI